MSVWLKRTSERSGPVSRTNSAVDDPALAFWLTPLRYASADADNVCAWPAAATVITAKSATRKRGIRLLDLISTSSEN